MESLRQHVTHEQLPIVLVRDHDDINLGALVS
jgi:hypothetical protein